MIIKKLAFFVAVLGNLSSSETPIPLQKEWTLNTSNKNKQEVLLHLFSQHGISLRITSLDLKEVDADPLTVAIHKASQMPDQVLIEDTSLEIAGVEIGVNLRRKFKYLIQHMDQYVGKKAIWTVILAYKEENQVYLYKGAVAGTFVSIESENGFNFDFLPEGADKSYTEDKPKCFDARALAIEAFIEQKPIAIQPVILDWQGPWQTDE